MRRTKTFRPALEPLEDRRTSTTTYIWHGGVAGHATDYGWPGN
jgi:hypothetical protein